LSLPSNFFERGVCDTTFSMPVVTMHPNKKWMLCQSLDNQILCYGSTGQVACIRFYPYSSSYYLLHADRFKLHKKKLFRGHNNAGFACGITTPPDGAHHLGIACHESSLQ
jgi:pre-mRNA-processing factor 17